MKVKFYLAEERKTRKEREREREREIVVYSAGAAKFYVCEGKKRHVSNDDYNKKKKKKTTTLLVYKLYKEKEKKKASRKTTTATQHNTDRAREKNRKMLPTYIYLEILKWVQPYWEISQQNTVNFN